MRLDLSHYLSKHAIDAPILSSRSQPPRRARVWILGAGIVVLLLLAVSFPTMISAAYLAAGVRALDAGASGAERAAAYLEQSRRWSPADPEIDRALARAYLRLEQPYRAVEALERAFRLRPDSLLIREELADAYAAAGQVQPAVAIWESLGMTPGDMLDLGNQMRQKKRYAEALAWFERAGRLVPDSVDPLVYAARVYRDAQQPDRALGALRRAAELEPANRDPWYELGQIYTVRKDTPAALEALQRGIAASEGRIGSSNLHYQVGYIQQHLATPRDLESAWVSYEQALARDDYRGQPALKADTFYQRGVILAARKQWREAADEYRQALTLNQNHYIGRVGLGDALWQLGHREAAKETARDAIERNPNRKEAYRLLGNMYRYEGDVASAREMYDRVLAIEPEDAAAQKALEALPRSGAD